MNYSRKFMLLILTQLAVTPCMSNANGLCKNDYCDSMETSSGNAIDEVAAMQLHLRTGATDKVPTSDDDCSWDYMKASCKHPDQCEYNYNFGDVTLSQSCRLKAPNADDIVNADVGKGATAGGGEQQCDWQCYLNRYAGLQKACGDHGFKCAKRHWDTHGQKEGRDCTCDTQVEEAPDFDGYHIKIAGGVKNERKYLSVESLGTDTDLWYEDDGSGRQMWIIANCTMSGCDNGEMWIKVFGGVTDWSAESSFLSVGAHTDGVFLYDHDDGSGRQRWLISPCEGCGPDEVNIKVAGGTYKGLMDWDVPVYLSTSKSGNSIDVHWEDDASGRQRWKLEQTNGTEHESLEHSMAEIASAVYDIPVSITGTAVSGWTIPIAHKDPNGIIGTDKVSIYQQGDKCALAVSGSDDGYDWVEDFNFISTQDCGVNMHGGFHEEAHRIAHNPWFPEIKAYLMSSSCSGGRYIVGHSLGGATASALAGCIEHWDALQGIDLTGLYTFGAPGVSKEVMTYKGGCFPGSRFYNYDLAGGDPVPWVTSIIGLKHPKMQAVRLRSWFGKTKETHSCDDYSTYSLPQGAFVPDIMRHLMPFYINRVGLLFMA